MTPDSLTRIQEKKKVGARLLLAFTLLSALIFLAATLVIQVPRINTSVEQTQGRSNAATATVFAAQLERYILDRELALRDIATNEQIANALLNNNRSSSAFLDFVDHALVLGEDADLTVLDALGNMFYTEQPTTDDYIWALNLVETKTSRILRIMPGQDEPRIELALPIFYGRGREGVLIALLDAGPEKIFKELELLAEESGLIYGIGDSVISSDMEDIGRPVEATVSLGQYPVQLAYVTSAKILDREKRLRITNSIFGTVVGAFVAFPALYMLGMKIILAPYRELAESQDAISRSVEGISRIDTNGNFVSVNLAYANAVGYGLKELHGRHWSVAVHSDDVPEAELAYKAMRENDTATIEVRGIRKDKSVFYQQMSMISQFDEKHVFAGHHIFMKDITKRKLAEGEREELISRLNDSNEELERFAYICSHDMQEPVRMIRSFGDKLKNHMEDKISDDEKAQRYLHFVIDGAERAQKLIADILDYSRLQHDTVRPEEINLNEIVDQAKETMESSLRMTGGNVTSDELPVVTGHKTQLYQLFQNLINNGLKYQSMGSKPQVHVGVKDAGDYWEFSIQDNGIGIEPRHQKKIFDIFQRLHRKDEYAGTGVGLSICRKIAERHGGRIRVESEKGRGSTFVFTIRKSNNQENPNELIYQTG